MSSPIAPAGTLDRLHQPRRATPSRVAVVVNGRAKKVSEELVGLLDQVVQSGDLFVSHSLEQGEQIARTIVERGYPTVLAGGGDGTFVQTVTWVLKEAARTGRPLPKFGLLRLGTGNALAWVLGAQRGKHENVVSDLARLRTSGGSRALRLLEVQGSLTPFAGMGLDAIALSHFRGVKAVFERAPWVGRHASGAAAYVTSIALRTLPNYMVRPKERVRVINKGEQAWSLGTDGRPVGPPIGRGEVLYDGPARMVCMSTIPYWGFGARIFPFADEREDAFNLRVVDIGSLDVVVHLPRIWRGTYRDDRLHDFYVRDVAIECDRPVPLQIGGDPAGEHRIVEAGLSEQPIEVVDYYSPPDL